MQMSRLLNIDKNLKVGNLPSHYVRVLKSLARRSKQRAIKEFANRKTERDEEITENLVQLH